MSRMLSGHPESLAMPPAPELPNGPWKVVSTATNTAWSGPWGVSFTANLTPDPETGLGKWTFRNFKDTIRTGRHMGRGRPILPPMPIPMYKHMTDDDLEAVFSYLQTIPAVKNRVPEPLPPSRRRSRRITERELDADSHAGARTSISASPRATFDVHIACMRPRGITRGTSDPTICWIQSRGIDFDSFP